MVFKCPVGICPTIVQYAIKGYTRVANIVLMFKRDKANCIFLSLEKAIMSLKHYLSFLAFSTVSVRKSSSTKFEKKRHRVVRPNFGHPAITSSFQLYALCRCCRHDTKISNHHSKAETISDSSFTIVAKLFSNIIYILKMTKLGPTNLPGQV